LIFLAVYILVFRVGEFCQLHSKEKEMPLGLAMYLFAYSEDFVGSWMIPEKQHGCWIILFFLKKNKYVKDLFSCNSSFCNGIWLMYSSYYNILPFIRISRYSASVIKTDTTSYPLICKSTVVIICSLKRHSSWKLRNVFLIVLNLNSDLWYVNFTQFL